MNRIHHTSDFRLRLDFIDLASMPVSAEGLDIDIWLYTEPGNVFLAAKRGEINHMCEVLDDGSLMVYAESHGLPCGQLHAIINVHPDNCLITEKITVRPPMAIELCGHRDDPTPHRGHYPPTHCGGHHAPEGYRNARPSGNPGDAILRVIRLPIRSRDIPTATAGQIDSICGMFAVAGKKE